MEQRECFTDDEEFNLYLDGELGGGRQSVLDSHVTSCKTCSVEYELAINLKSSLRRSCEGVEAPTWLREKIINSIRTEKQEKSGRFWESAKSMFSGRPLVPIGVAACLVVILASAIYYGRPGDGNMPFISEMVHEHYEYLEDLSELGIFSNDPSEISSWMSSNVGMNMQLPSGAEALVPGGACVLEMEGEDMGYVFFDRDDKRISLFMINDNYDTLFGQKTMNVDDISIYCGSCTGMNYVLWKNEDLICVLVGDLPEASLIGMAKGFI